MSTSKKILVTVGAIAILGVIIGFSINAGRTDAVSVETGNVERKSELIAIVSATGEIKPKEYVEIQAEISGVITDLYVQEGDVVEKGGLLLRIDPAQTESETKAQEAILQATFLDAQRQKGQISVQESNVERDLANVRVAEVDLNRYKTNLDLARRIFERKQGLYEDNLISKDAYEIVKNDLVNAESAVATAEVRLAQAKAQYRVSKVVLEQTQASFESSLSRVEQQRAFLERSQDMLSKTIIRSPLAGVITQMNVEAGERAVPGTLNNPSATLMVIADLSVIEAEVEVDETDIVDLKLGQSAVVKVDALPDDPIDGTVTEIGNSAIATPGQSQEAKDFKVVIQLMEPPSALRPGLSCTGEITTATRKDVLSIPIQALTVREFPVDADGNMILLDPKKKENKRKVEGSIEDSKSEEKEEFEGVFKVVEGKAEFTPVDTGILGDTEIEVTSGLDEGETIVTGSYKTLRTLGDGDPVEVEEEERG